MKIIFKYTLASALASLHGVAAAPAPAAPAPAPAATAPVPAAPADDPADRSVDVDAEDRAALDAAEVISVEDKSDGTKLVESAGAVTVIDLKQDRERASDLGEVLSRAHGLQIRRSGGLGSAARLSLNGLYDDQVRLFIDGIPLELSGWGLGIANVPVDLIQRVDVYRGVVPISLGADALGGAIDLVTDPSWVDRASVSYQLGSFGVHRVSLGGRVHDDATGLALGVSLFTDRAANDYPIQVDVADERGKLVPVTVRRFHDGYTAGGTIVEAGVVKRGPIEHALLRMFFSEYDKQLQHNTVMTVPYGDVSYDSGSRGIAGDLAFASGPWRGRLVLGVSITDTDFHDVGTGIYDWYGHRIGERSVPGEIGTDPASTRITETDLYARGTLERSLAATDKLRIAVAPTSARRRGHDFLDSNPAGRDPIEAKRELVQLVTGVEYEHTAYGGALENIAFVKDYLLLTDAEEARPGFVFVPSQRTLHHVGAGDSLRYKLSTELFAKASYEWATRMPSVDELFGDGILVHDNVELLPETSHNANLGLQLDHAATSGTWGGELTGFARLADDLILLVGNDRLFSYQNVYAARILGVEGSAGWIAPGEWASLEANLTLQDIRNASSDGPFGAFNGDRIPNRPWLLGSLAGSVRQRDLLRPGDELSLFATSRYVHSFLRGWESQGLPDSKQIVASQLVHGVGVTYALRGAAPIITTLELQNATDARVFDSFGVQRPGRALLLKISAEM